MLSLASCFCELWACLMGGMENAVPKVTAFSCVIDLLRDGVNLIPSNY